MKDNVTKAINIYIDPGWIETYWKIYLNECAKEQSYENI